MIHTYLVAGILGVLGVLILVMLGQKLRIAYPIFLVIAGLMISFIPGAPRFVIDPDLVFLIFLPPILFEAAWFTSWKDFWKFKKTIFSMAIGLVLITSTVVALISSAIIPGMTLALGFLLGGINSPPDAVAATSVLKHMKLPKKITTILEGESLINDASSLIVFKFALVAVLTGHFIFKEAALDFFLIAGMGAVAGLALGWFFSWLLRWLPSNSNIDTVLTIVIPYVIYIVAEHFHFSGVMAVVSAGLLMSYNANCFLSHTTRIQAVNVWNTLIFGMNAAIFVMIGLELPIVIDGMTNYSITDAILYSLIIGAAIILTRFAWCYFIAYVPIVFGSRKGKDHIKPNWQESFVLSISAMRGVVSLASALAIPFLMTDGSNFPLRNIILFITFSIIIITLVGQGLLLPFIMKWLKIKSIDEAMPREKQEALINKRLKSKALETMNSEYGNEIAENRLVNHLKVKLESDVNLLNEKMDCIATSDKHKQAYETSRNVYRNIINTQRNELRTIRKEQNFEDDVLRNLEMQLDLEETKITGFGH
jgi:CPA1 family monovalent cation:H+ antiporter